MDPDNNDDPSRDILAAYRKLRVPPAIRDAAWDRLQLAIEDPDTLPEVAYQRPGRARWAVALLTAAALVLVFAGLRRMADHGSTAADHQSAQDAARTGEPARTSARGDDESSPQIQPPPTPTPARLPPPPERRTNRPSTDTTTTDRPGDEPTSPADSSLESELRLLRAARAALTAHDTGTALRLLGEHAAKFTSGHLREERMVLRVQALCERGERPSAREAAAELLRAYPGSPNATTTSCPEP